jgi:probable phosphoglycerate mutase
MTRFLLVRHGDTDAVGRYHAGRAAGVHINAEGRRQVQQLVAVLHDVPLAAVVSSPLERTRETAEPVAADHRLDVIVEPAIVEFDVGDWTGATFASLAADDRWRRFNAVRGLTRAPRGESMLDVQQRAVAAILALRDRFGAGPVMVVSHGDVLRAVLQFFLGMPIDLFQRIEVSPARISIVDLMDEAAHVLQVNGDSVSLPL